MSGWFFLGAAMIGTPARACPGKDEACAEKRQASADPGHCARRADLVGPGACSWTTEMVAQRVLEEGTPWTYVGTLVRSENALPSKVAAPYTIGPEGRRIHVVANEVLETVDTTGRVSLVGRVLDVDGTTYFVATTAEPGNS